MQEAKNQRPLSKKAFEICYAIFRIGNSIQDRVFVEHIEAWALALLEAANAPAPDKAASAILNLEYLINLARNINFISEVNCGILIREIRTMNVAVAEFAQHNAPEIDLQDIFKDEQKVDTTVNGSQQVSMSQDKEGLEVAGYQTNAGNNMKAAIRQSAIIDKMRQSGICRLKDFEDLFPSASERTIRYDIQNLIEQGTVVRIGNGGPATAYRLIKEEQKMELPAPVG